MHKTQRKRVTRWSLLTIGCLMGLLNPQASESVEATNTMLGGPSHIGTFEGSTTFTTSSSNGINPGLYLEVMDEYGNYTEYTSEEGVITVPDTKEGAYITQAKLLGKTKYVDQDTGEILDQWEAGRHLKLESVKRPVLKTTGKNLLNVGDMLTSSFNGNTITRIERGFKITTSTTSSGWNQNVFVTIDVKENTDYVYSFTKNVIIDTYPNGNAQWGSGYTFIRGVQSDSVLMEGMAYDDNRTKIKFNTKGNNKIRIYHCAVSDSSPQVGEYDLIDFQLEEATSATSYEPYQSNILTVNEDVTLRGIGDVQDELDLVTSEKVERISEIVLDGSEDWVRRLEKDNTLLFQTNVDVVNGKSSYGLSDKFPYRKDAWTSNVDQEGVLIGGPKLTRVDIAIAKNKLTTSDVTGFKAYLQSNQVTVYYQLATPVIKTVVLTSTYAFQPVMNREVRVEGVAMPLVCSVTVPTELLTFVINPNGETEEEQFIAPEFRVINESPASINVTLKAFEQTSAVFNDVLPTKYADWSMLTKEQSKDLALALEPLSSEGWISLTKGPRYVAEGSNRFIGEVKPEADVQFTFSAKHGRAFTEQLTSQYRLSFIFEF